MKHYNMSGHSEREIASMSVHFFLICGKEGGAVRRKIVHVGGESYILAQNTPHALILGSGQFRKKLMKSK